MARYNHGTRYDTISHKISRYDTIRYESASPYVRTACRHLQDYSYIRTHIQQQAGNSAQHWSTVILPIDTVTAAGAWILADQRGGRFLWSPESFSRVTVSTGRQIIAAVETLAQRAIARLKYLVIAQSLNIWAVRPPSESTHRPTR